MEVDTSVRVEAVVPHFRVRNVVQTAEYYRDVLGFEIVGYWDGEAAHHDPARPVVFGIVRRDRASIHFQRAESLGLPSNRAGRSYDVYFDVTGVDPLGDDLRARGADIVDGPVDRVYGRREVVVRDCDGRILAFGEDLARSGS